MDANLFRTSRPPQGSQEGYSTCRCQLFWLHCQSYRSSGCLVGSLDESQGPRSSIACLFYCRYRYASSHTSSISFRTDSSRFTAIVAETCGPFTCIPAVLNEYRTPELNVRNGCLKAMSFLFEYIGEMGKDYIHSVVTCLEDALTDRDQVHRQTAASIVKHLALGTAGLGAEDANLHLMNLIWPNIFESRSISKTPLSSTSRLISRPVYSESSRNQLCT